MNNAVTMCPDANASLGRIDQYELIRELGGGGFGCVYLARDTVAGIDVAVKGLPPLVRLNKEELENVRKNFALVSRLHHPNIAAALHLQKVEKAFYDDKADAEKLRVFGGDTLVVMQYAPGVTLSQWRKQFPEGKVPLDKALEITLQIASALDYAHEEKILHRDIKPANVMIETAADGKLTARVLDFGLAAEIRSSMGRVSQQVCDTSGTRPYMAPEQWLGKAQGRATDQYALAVLFCELMTGKVPFASVFETGDPVVMMNVVGREEPELTSDLPKSICAAILKALAKKREDRFDSCLAFVDALVGRGVLTAPSGKAFGKIAAVGLLVLGLAGGVWYWQDAKAKEEARIVAEQKAEAERKAAEEARRIAEEKAKKEKAEAERRQKEEAARIAAEKARAEAENRARKAEEARIAVEKEAERKAELEVFRLSSEAQSAHDLIDRESVEIKKFFATEIRAFENDRRAGEDAKQNSKYVIATNFFAQALTSATALKAMVTKFNRCIPCLMLVDLMKSDADKVGAAEALSGRYNAAQQVYSAARAGFKAKRFDECIAKAQEAKKLFESLRTDVIKATLDLAEGHKTAERWEQCKQEAEKVLGWDANNPKALQLKTEAEKHLVPSLKVVTTIDGDEVRGAKVKINGEESTTPLKWEKLENGASVGPYDFTFTRYGKNYVGTLSRVTVNWLGLQTLIVELKESKDEVSQIVEDSMLYFEKIYGGLKEIEVVPGDDLEKIIESISEPCVIKIKAGTYSVGNIEIPCDINLIGDEKGQTFIKCKTIAIGERNFSGEKNKKMLIKNLTLQGENGASGLICYEKGNLIVTNCKIRNCSVRIYSKGHLFMAQSELYSMEEWGVSIGEGAVLVMSHCSFQHGKSDNIILFKSSRCLLNQVEILNSLNYAEGLTCNGDNIEVFMNKCKISRCATGISAGSARVFMNNCVVENCRADPITLSNEVRYYDCRFIGNKYPNPRIFGDGKFLQVFKPISIKNLD